MAIELHTTAMARGGDKGKGRAAEVQGDDDVYELPPPLSSSSRSEKKKQMQKPEAKKSSSSRQHGNVDASSSSSSNFKTITAVSRFPLAPIFALDSLDGVRQCLQSWTMRYIPSIDGVLVSFVWPPEILQHNAPLAPSSAYALIHARWTGTVFRPQIGAKTSVLLSQLLDDTYIVLTTSSTPPPSNHHLCLAITAGRLSLATPSTISLLLHNLFNASISSDQIPKDKYEWDPNAKLPYSLAPAANLQFSSTSLTSPRKASTILPEDPSLGQDGIQADLAGADEQHEGEEEEVERGCWVHKETREPLGGSTGHIDFTVIGLTIANSMISTHGSLLDVPLQLTNSKDSSKSKKRKKNEESKSRKRARQ